MAAPGALHDTMAVLGRGLQIFGDSIRRACDRATLGHARRELVSDARLANCEAVLTRRFDIDTVPIARKHDAIDVARGPRRNQPQTQILEHQFRIALERITITAAAV